MAIRDLREFMAALEPMDEIRTVDGADWDLEIGAITELNFEREGPALLFDHIKGYPKGYRILCNAVETLPRALLALGLPTDLDTDAAIAQYEAKLSSYAPVPETEVQSGPILENAYFGDDVDLWKFPTPRWHEADGGRYIGTGSMVIMRDPDTGEVNLGTYRVMVHDRNTAGLFIVLAHTGAQIQRKYWARGQICPVAVCLGEDPLLFLCSAAYVQTHRREEYEQCGYFRGESVEVIREEVTGLPIPAGAEIVIAGEIPPPDVEMRDEGPFAEYTGYYASATRPEPVIKVQAMYHRNDPILLGMPPYKYRGPSLHFGIPHHIIDLRAKVKKAGIDGVLDVWEPVHPGLKVVQVKQRYPGHAMKAALALTGDFNARFVVVVDEDINPRDPVDVLWAIATRCDPATTISILNGCSSTQLDPRLPPDKKLSGDLTTSCAIIDACKPFHWIDQFPAANIASQELRREVLTKWKELFQ